MHSVVGATMEAVIEAPFFFEEWRPFRTYYVLLIESKRLLESPKNLLTLQLQLASPPTMWVYTTCLISMDTPTGGLRSHDQRASGV